MRNRLFVVLLISFFLIFPNFLFSQNQQVGPVTIGLILDGPWGGQNQMLQSIKKEILDLTTGEFDVQFPSEKTIVAGWNLSSIQKGIDQLLADEDVDILIALGTLSSHEICQRKELSKPVIAPYILDAEFQNITFLEGKSGIPNLNYISVPAPFKRDIEIFKEIIPFEKLAVLVNNSLLEGFPQLKQRMVNFFEKFEIDVSIIGVKTSARQALSELTSDIEAVYVLPLSHFSDKEFTTLVEGLIEKNYPVFLSEVQKELSRDCWLD